MAAKALPFVFRPAWTATRILGSTALITPGQGRAGGYPSLSQTKLPSELQLARLNVPPALPKSERFVRPGTFGAPTCVIVECPPSINSMSCAKLFGRPTSNVALRVHVPHNS